MLRRNIVNNSRYEHMYTTIGPNGRFIISPRLLFHVNHLGLPRGFIFQRDISSTLALNPILDISFLIRVGNDIGATSMPPRHILRSISFRAMKPFERIFTALPSYGRIFFVVSNQFHWQDEALAQHAKVRLFYALLPGTSSLTTCLVRLLVQFPTGWSPLNAFSRIKIEVGFPIHLSHCLGKTLSNKCISSLLSWWEKHHTGCVFVKT